MNVDSRVRELAPDLDRSQERVARLRAQVLRRATDPGNRPSLQSGRPSVRRWVMGGVIATAAASALVVGPTLIPNTEPFAANALTPLAQAAEKIDVPPLSGGRVLHRITEYRQTETTSGKVTLVRWEEWTLADGEYYRQITVDGKIAPVEYMDVISSVDFTPRQIAALPTDPAALLEAIEDSPQAAHSSTDPNAAQALLSTIIYRGYAPTKVWAAAIEAYGSFDDVRVRVDEARGITFVTETAKGGPITERFDTATGQLLGYDSTSPQDGGRTEAMRVISSKVENDIPAQIVDRAIKAGG